MSLISGEGKIEKTWIMSLKNDGSYWLGFEIYIDLYRRLRGFLVDLDLDLYGDNSSQA